MSLFFIPFFSGLCIIPWGNYSTADFGNGVKYRRREESVIERVFYVLWNSYLFFYFRPHGRLSHMS